MIPTWSSDGESAATPVVGIRPYEGLKPTTPQYAAIERIERWRGIAMRARRGFGLPDRNGARGTQRCDAPRIERAGPRGKWKPVRSRHPGDVDDIFDAKGNTG
jgi:hypothetical protein